MTAQRRGRRERPAAAAADTTAAVLPQPRLGFPPVPAVSADELDAIHRASLAILEEIGMDVLDAEARDILRGAGAAVDAAGPRVRFDRGLVEATIGKAPTRFVLHARSPVRSVEIGGDAIAFGSVASAPNVADRARGRRPGNRADFDDLLRLAQSLPAVHVIAGYPVEPADIHASVRHLDALFDMLTLSDKPIHAYSLGRQRILDGIEMARIARGVDRATLEREASLFTIINTSSPLRLDEPMAQGVIEMARANQAVCVTPFTLAGAMAPVTIAGAVAQQNAEALAGLVLAQAVRPGSPFIYGGFTSNVDMKSGAPAFGTPEYMRATQMTGQMARFYGLPMRASGTCAANIPDGQAMWETSNSLWSAVQSGTNIVYHAAGWLEGGLIASPEKFVMDCEMLQMIQRYMEPEIWATGPEEIALDAIREVGASGHYFCIQHTQDRYEHAFYAPFVSDWRNYEAWEIAGSVWTPERAHRLFKEIIAGFEEPPMDAGHRAALADFVARRKSEGGAPTDF